jgi:hypothetical protein
VLVTVLFFVPCLILGMISPVVAKLAVRDLAKTGTTVGKIYAAGTVGSIAGTFATGFVLIAWFGTTPLSGVWPCALIGMALIFFWAGRWQAMAAAALVVVIGLGGAQAAGWLSSRCTMETNYFCIKVREEERNGKTGAGARLGPLVHSYSSLEDPTQLVYGYEQLYAQLTLLDAAGRRRAGAVHRRRRLHLSPLHGGCLSRQRDRRDRDRPWRHAGGLRSAGPGSRHGDPQLQRGRSSVSGA